MCFDNSCYMFPGYNRSLACAVVSIIIAIMRLSLYLLELGCMADPEMWYYYCYYGQLLYHCECEGGVFYVVVDCAKCYFRALGMSVVYLRVVEHFKVTFGTTSKWCLPFRSSTLRLGMLRWGKRFGVWRTRLKHVLYLFFTWSWRNHFSSRKS